MAKKLFSSGGSEPISPLIDVIMNAFGAMFIILIIYLAAARPVDVTPLLFLKEFTPPPAILGQNYLFTLPVTGGTGVRSFTLIKGNLSELGLDFDLTTGSIFGVPTLSKKTVQDNNKIPLTVDFEFTVTDTGGGQDSIKTPLDFHIGAVPYPTAPFSLVRENEILAPGRVGDLYEAVIGSIGGALPVSWSISSGKIPTGIKLDTKTGRLYGKPSQPGNFRFTLTAEHTPGGYEINGQQYSWNGGEQKRSFVLTIIKDSKYSLHLPIGRVGEPYFAAVVSNTRLPDDQILWDAPVQGLLPSPEKGSLTGVPAKAGRFPVSYTVRKGAKGGRELDRGTGELTILPAKPEISLKPITLQAWVGEAMSYPLPYRGLVEPVEVVTLSPLPTGISLDKNVLIGTPEKPSMVTIPLRLQDALGQNADTAITIRIGPHREPLTIDEDKELILVAGRPTTWAPSAYGGEGNFLWQLQDSLPPKLSFKRGRLQGTLTEPGSWSSTLVVKDTITGENKTRSLLIHGVYPETSTPVLVTKSLPSGTAGLPYNFIFSSTGGVGILSYTFDGTLPKGLQFTENGISGKPTEGAEIDIEVTVTDEKGQHSEPGLYHLQIVEKKPELLTATIPTAIVGRPYSITFAAQGGVGHLSVKVRGKLPKGLNYKDNTISGIPLKAGKSSFKITAIDEIGQKSKTIALRLITEVLDHTSPVLVAESIPDAIVGLPFAFTFPVSGGVGLPHYSFKGKLPKGVKFNRTGFSGRPLQAGTFKITVKAADEIGNNAPPQSYNLVVRNIDRSLPEVLTTRLPPLIPGLHYQAILSAEGGNGKYRWSVKGSLPKGITVNGYIIEGDVSRDLLPGTWSLQIGVEDELGQKSPLQTVQLVSIRPDLIPSPTELTKKTE